MTSRYQITSEPKIIGRTAKGAIRVQLPHRFGEASLQLNSDSLAAEIVAGDDLLLFCLTDHGGEDTLTIYLVNKGGQIEDTIESWGAYADCQLKLLEVGERICFSFFNDALCYALGVTVTPRLQLLPNLTGVKRANRFAVRSRLVLREHQAA